VSRRLCRGGVRGRLVHSFPAWSARSSSAATIVGSVFPAERAWQSIKRGSLDINVLMVVAVIGAVVIRQFEEAAMVVSLFAAAQWLEAQSLDRARKAIGKLLDLAVDRCAHPRRSRRAPPRHRTGRSGRDDDRQAGEKFALDGIVRSGRSDVNQAPITGESLPVEKVEGDEVFAGTINGHGALAVAVTRRRADTTLARIVHLVESAQAKRAPVQLFIDRFAAWYTPSVVILALAVATVPVIAFGQPFDAWFYRALVLLVVSCPCALVISTPVSIVSALAERRSRGSSSRAAFTSSGWPACASWRSTRPAP
jgi:Cd2+/Zn2+-exporting ATPase